MTASYSSVLLEHPLVEEKKHGVKAFFRVMNTISVLGTLSWVFAFFS